MSIHFKCDDESCRKPIEPTDNHISLEGVRLVKDRKLMQGGVLHFCDHKCACSFITKMANRPVLITPNQTQP